VKRATLNGGVNAKPWALSELLIPTHVKGRESANFHGVSRGLGRHTAAANCRIRSEYRDNLPPVRLMNKWSYFRERPGFAFDAGPP
jgi:hypothetical protein